jgi:hypothetical protein
MNLDVDTCISNCKLAPYSVWRKGERRSANGKAYETSGLGLEVSSADFSDRQAQTEDALAFFESNQDWISRLTKFPGVERAVADFGLEIRPPYWASFSFDPKLLALLGLIGVTLGISTYPTGDEEEVVASDET